MKKALKFIFEKWWVTPILSILILFIAVLQLNTWLFVIGLTLTFIFFIIQLYNKRKRSGYTSLILFILYLFIPVVWFIMLIISTPFSVHYAYSKQYENRKEIERIIGVDIPRFKVVESDLVHLSNFDFEFEVQTTIKFRKPLGDDFFNKLDSIRMLPMPDGRIDESSYFYQSLESKHRTWNKVGDRYIYSRNVDFGEEFLHSKDAYFYFTVTRGSNIAEIKYGNF